MKVRLVNEVLDRSALTELLAAAEIVSSQAIEGATVYRIRQSAEEHIVVTLPEGGAVVVKAALPAPPERRGPLKHSAT